MSAKKFDRLPNNVLPVRYRIYVAPDLVNSTFEGQVDVQISIRSLTKTIKLNSLDLEIKSSRLELGDGTVLIPLATKLSKEDETLTLELASEITPAEGVNLHLEFAGILNDSLKGLYRSRTSPIGQPVKYAAVTQFAPTDARRCFPCWDEPAIKSVFEVTLAAPKDAVAISNMPCVSEEVKGDVKVCTFAPSPIMSTYLVAMVVGNYDYIEDTSDDGVLVRVYTPPGSAEMGRFALHVSTKVLPYYKDYFQLAYPLPKLDVIAVADLAYGAMENWGLATFRESRLLVDSANCSADFKQIVALIIGHEFAHQWFGNIVTMEWWTHLWLNEGFANFVQNLCVAHLFPDYNIWTQFVNDILSQALNLDALETSHPIEVPVNFPAEINEIFDTISYCKGASIILMLHRFIGDEHFRKGMNLYLTRHKYKNACTEDLWKALEEASNMPVEDIMSSWTRLKGFPLVTVESAIFENGNLVLTVSQAKFVANPSTKSDDSLWMIPLNIVTQKGIKHSCIIREKSDKVVIPNVSENEWVKLNSETTGFFRILYPAELFNRLIPPIVDRSLSSLDRMGLLDDAMALAKAGHCDTVHVLKLICSMATEDDPVVWKIIARCMNQLSVIVSYTAGAEKFKTFGRHVFNTVSKRISWDVGASESHTERLLRTIVLNKLAEYGDLNTLDKAMNCFNAKLAGTEKINADLVTPVYKSVAIVGGNSSYEALIKLYRAGHLEERERILNELGGFSSPDILAKVLDFAMSDEVKSQDKKFVLFSVAKSKVGRELVWELMKSKWSQLYKWFEGGFLLSTMVKNSLENFASEARALEIEEFFAKADVKEVARSVQQVTESIRCNAAWLARDRNKIEEYLNASTF